MPSLTKTETTIRELHEDDACIELALDGHMQRIGALWGVILSDGVVDEADRQAIHEIRLRTEAAVDLTRRSLEKTRQITGLYCELASERRQWALAARPAERRPDLVA